MSNRNPVVRTGTKNRNHKVNDYEVRTIRALWPSHSFAVLGRMYGLSKQQVHRIVRGAKWRHVPLEERIDETRARECS